MLLSKIPFFNFQFCVTHFAYHFYFPCLSFSLRRKRERGEGDNLNSIPGHFCSGKSSTVTENWHPEWGSSITCGISTCCCCTGVPRHRIMNGEPNFATAIKLLVKGFFTCLALSSPGKFDLGDRTLTISPVSRQAKSQFSRPCS